MGTVRNKKTTVVVNCRHQSYDIMIDRSTVFGNPYRIGKDGSREEVIEKYRGHLKTSVAFGIINWSDLRRLKGKRLGCWCKPHACHGDVILEVMKEMNIL